jgi:hypothetical protein
MATERCDVTAAINRASNLLDLTIEYRLISGRRTDQEIELRRSDLDAALSALRDDGWQLESQCANPTPEWYTETYSFKREVNS